MAGPRARGALPRWRPPCLLPPLLAAFGWLSEYLALAGGTANFLGAGVAAASLGDGASAAPAQARRLASIAATLPSADVALRLTINGTTEQVSPTGSISTYAGLPVEAVEIVLTGSDTWSTDLPRLKFVRSSVTNGASGACTAAATALGAAHLTGDFVEVTGALATEASTTELAATLSGGDFPFLMGGSYAICYSDIGTFASGHADVMDSVTVEVAGVHDSCLTANCLTNKRYHCYASKSSQSASGYCALSYEGYTGTLGKVSWSEAWSATYDSSTGAQQSLSQKACQTAPDETVMCPEPPNDTAPVCWGEDYILDAGETNTTLPQMRPLTSMTTGFTVAACYCADLRSCDDPQDFPQQIGLLYIFVAKVCDPAQATCSSLDGYVGVAPQHDFTVMVHCPPGGCAADDASRVKLADAGADNNNPWWASNGCGEAPQTSYQAAPTNCPSPTSCELTGGSRQDYKEYGTSSPFSLHGGGTDYEARNFHSSKSIDVCMCLDDCYRAANWFKVGEMVFSPYRLLSLSNNLAIVKVDGTLGFYRPSGDQDSLGLTADSILKVLPDPTGSSVSDSECASSAFDTAMMQTATRDVTISTYQGQPLSGDSTQLVFDGGVSTNLYTPGAAGIIAICYCRSNSCAEVSDDWILAARMTLRGPTTNQQFTFSIGIPVRIEYSGHGLTSTDTLRVISGARDCTDGGNDPNSVSALQVGCPLACTEAGNHMNLATQIAAHDKVGCDAANANCGIAYVTKVVVRSPTTTEVEFDAVPGLRTGDRIVLGSGVQCGSDCSAEQLAAVTGRRTFGNGGEYSVGVAVTATSDRTRFTLPVGFSGAVPTFEVPLGQGQWSRTSSAISAEELQSGQADNLKICWGYSGGGTYVEQVGTLVFTEPGSMTATVNLLTHQTGATAPVVISFSTGDHSEYANAVNSMQLKLQFTILDKFVPHYVNGDPITVVPGQAENSLEEASQTTCGKLFAELWSGDSASGFPMPKGCYHREVGSMQEVGVVFDAKNGLRAQTAYQMVMTVSTLSGLDNQKDALYILSMGDTVLSPYQVVQRATAKTNLNLAPDLATAPRFAPAEGFSVLHGPNAVFELTAGEMDMSFALAAHPDYPGIVRQAVLRIFTYPLTQWDMSYIEPNLACQLTCTAFPGTTCSGATGCSTDHVVWNAQKNIVVITLPGDMSDITFARRHEFRLRGLTLPPGGFFPLRFGVQISMPDNAGPDWMESGGALLWKRQASTSAVAELVTKEGDGNSRPFRGDSGNVLHLHLVLGTTLRAVGEESGATLSIRMPQGYSGASVSATSQSLQTFSDSPVLGRGTLHVSKWTCNANVCTYTLRMNDAIYAGSSLFATFTLNNPAGELPAADTSNQWSVELHGRGHHTTSVGAAPAQAFAAVSGSTWDFGRNVAVLGMLEGASLQPSSFAISPSGGTAVRHDLFIFFRAEQAAGAGAFVIVDAPALFDFENPCTSRGLAEPYYRRGAGTRTWPLPNIASCTGGYTDASDTAVFNRATIALSGILHADRSYGFRIRVTNPESYAATQQTSWRVWTKTSAGYYVDGVPSTVRLNPAGGGDTSAGGQSSWGMYRAIMSQPAHIAVSLSSMLPYSLSGQEATITVHPLKVAADLETPLRITAPLGFEWYFSAQDFAYRASGPGVALPVPEATADLPGGIPTKSGNVLTWPVATYLARRTYGFITKIRVPDQSPTQSANAFFVEFGYSDRAWSGTQRSAAARVEAPAVRALGNADVHHSTNVRGQVNTVAFRVDTATAIPTGGGLLIQGPVGFLFPDFCHPRAVAGSSHMPLPLDLSCTSRATSNGAVQIDIEAGAGGLPAGQYHFEIQGTNPAAASANYEGANTACGATHCWTFHSVLRVLDGLNSQELDLRQSVAGFAIKDPMPVATLVELSDAGRTATGRDDKPGSSNRVAFTFRLSQDVTERAVFTLRGPAGTVFSEDCLADDGIVTEPAGYFGAGASYLEPHGAWEFGVPVLACSGAGAEAHFEVGAGLKTAKPYLFAIRVASNPQQTPDSNKWSLEGPGESSTPFDGFRLWTFSATSLTPTTAAMVPPSATQADRVLNLLNVTFRPFSDIPVGGVLRMVAPAGFTFDAGQDCPKLLTEVDPLHDALYGASTSTVVFQSSEAVCSGAVPGAIAFPARQLYAGRDYTLVIGVFNPTSVTPPGQEPPTWRLSSYADAYRTQALDTAIIPGFAVNHALTRWSYRTAGSFTANGAAQLPGLLLEMSFPDPLRSQDSVEILAPPGYDLADPSNRPGETLCNSLQWGPAGAGYFTSSTATLCRGNRLTIHVGEAAEIPADTLVQLTVSTANPETSPTFAANFWGCTHRTPAGDVLSSEVFESWRIVPQLSNVQVGLFGEGMAGALGVLDFRFTAVSSAVSLTIVAREPAGFDFSRSNPLFVGQTLLSSINSRINVGVQIAAGAETLVRIGSVGLPPVGGETTFDLTTYSTGGASADQRAGVRSGLRIPGSVTVSDARLESEYQLSPSLYPVKALWRVHVGSNAVASITFSLSNRAESGHSIRIVGEPYDLVRPGFSITHLRTAAEMAAAISTSGGSELVAELQSQLTEDEAFRLTVGVVTQRVAFSTETIWRIEILDGGLLPLNRNTEVAVGFTLVPNYIVQVETPKSPPNAQVEVSISAILGDTRPVSLTLVAPPEYVFNQGCLLAGGAAIIACEPADAVAGMPAARLVTVPAGASGTINFKVRVTSPFATPPRRNWLLEGLAASGEQVGWGEDVVGFAVAQMRDTSVIYAGVPSIITRVAVRFRTREIVDRGGQIQIHKPATMTFDCNPSALWEISLPGIVQCQVDPAETAVLLTLNGTLMPGEYAFILTAQTPEATPDPNLFSVLLMDSTDFVQDAAMNIPGQTLYPELAIEDQPLSWTASEPAQASVITMLFTVSREIAANTLGWVLITFPENFAHAVERDSSIVSANPDLPLFQDNTTGWADISMVDRIIIRLDPAATIPVGEFGFSFPVTVPEQMPASNIWMLTFCSPNGLCQQVHGAQSLVTFARPGFVLGQAGVSQGSAAIISENAAPRAAIGQIAVALLACLFSALPWLA